MKKVGFIFAFIVLVLSCYSQKKDTTFNLKRINMCLAQGLEAKELLKEKVIELAKADTAIDILQSDMQDCKQEVSLLKQNAGIEKTEKDLCLNNLEAQKAATEKEKKHVKFWRRTTVVLVFVAVVEGLFLYLH